MRTGKNPLLRTHRPTLPHGRRSRAAHLLTAAAAEGRFALPQCRRCGAFAWPIPEACPHCLGAIALSEAPRGARVIAATTAEVPADPYFRERAPWHVGLVQMDCGPQALVHLHPGAEPRDAVRLSLVLDRAGAAVLHAALQGGTMSDPQLREMTADPRDRRVLITDARHVAALPLACALSAAGAAAVYAGVPEDWKPLPRRAEFEAIVGLKLVPLDISSDRSVADLARDIGDRIEILVNTADLPRPGPLSAPAAATDARAMMEIMAMGLLRLARSFGPAMARRGADGTVAWVNVLSVYSRIHPAALAGYAAAHAAALALSHALRAELAQGGVRLMTVLAAPTEDEWFQSFGPIRVSGRALAGAILSGLHRGLEEVVVGDLAHDLLARLAENPKAVERELTRDLF